MSTPWLLPADSTLWLIEHLRTTLNARPEGFASSALVAGGMPNPIPPRIVTVRRDGGPRLDLTRDLARFGINVVATTEKEVNDLSAIVRAAVWQLRNTHPVKDLTETSGPSAVTDPSGRPWRYLTFELLTRIGAS